MANLEMGAHVCAALAASPLAHVVYISSDAVYDDGETMVRETSCCNPGGFHGVMHLTRERMLAHTATAAQTPLAILRPSLLYGPGDPHNGYGPNRFLRTARTDGAIALFGEGEEKRDHVFIDDVGRFVTQCLLHRSEGVVNVATGTSHSFREAAEAIAGALGGGVTVQGRARSNPITHRHFDTAVAVRAFPEFRFTPIEAGISLTVRGGAA
jgi:nucleoside-diphosphate-sugar epimerase